MGLDLTSFDAAMKQHYTADRIMNMVYKDNPFLAMVKKMEEFGGRNLPIPLIYGNPANRSASFSVAVAGTSSSKLSDFLLTRAHDYSICQIDNEALESSKGNENAFLEAATVEIDGAINALTRSLAVKSFKGGWGNVGNINATVTGTTLTLTNAADIVNFEVNQVIQFAQTESASSLRNSGASLTVTAVDRAAGSMTVSADLSTITGLSSGDYIFLKGDRQDSATPTRQVLTGLAGWLPSSAPSSTAFFGVDRSVDSTRLGGQRISASGMPIEEALLSGAAQIAREGGKPTHAFMNYDTYTNLQNSLGSKVQFVDVKVNPEVGFRGITVNGPRGPIQCIPDQNCPANTIYMLQLDTWKLYSLGKMVRTFDTDGLTMLRQATSDGVEVRVVSYSNLGCSAPGWNGVISL